MKVLALPLSNSQHPDRLVKRAALSAFSALRIVAEHANKAPGILTQASADVRDAWQESARPNV
jgi:hypothetical protein